MASAKYEAALAKWRVAAQAFNKVTAAYRARQIDDAAYLAGRKAFEVAGVEHDLAEQEEKEVSNAV